MTCRSRLCLLWGWCEGAGARLGKCNAFLDTRVVQASEGSICGSLAPQNGAQRWTSWLPHHSCSGRLCFSRCTVS